MEAELDIPKPSDSKDGMYFFGIDRLYLRRKAVDIALAHPSNFETLETGGAAVVDKVAPLPRLCINR